MDRTSKEIAAAAIGLIEEQTTDYMTYFTSKDEMITSCMNVMRLAHILSDEKEERILCHYWDRKRKELYEMEDWG